MYRDRQFALGLYLDTRLQPLFALPVEAEEAHPLVLEILIDLLDAECLEHRVGFVVPVFPFLDIFAHFTAKCHISFEKIRRV